MFYGEKYILNLWLYVSTEIIYSAPSMFTENIHISIIRISNQNSYMLQLGIYILKIGRMET